jgi:hypothetical protein
MTGILLGCQIFTSPSSIANQQRRPELTQQHTALQDLKRDPRGSPFKHDHSSASLSHPVDPKLVERDLTSLVGKRLLLRTSGVKDDMFYKVSEIRISEQGYRFMIQFENCIGCEEISQEAFIDMLNDSFQQN